MLKSGGLRDTAVWQGFPQSYLTQDEYKEWYAKGE